MFCASFIDIKLHFYSLALDLFNEQTFTIASARSFLLDPRVARAYIFARIVKVNISSCIAELAEFLMSFLAATGCASRSGRRTSFEGSAGARARARKTPHFASRLKRCQRRAVRSAEINVQ